MKLYTVAVYDLSEDVHEGSKTPVWNISWKIIQGRYLLWKIC